MFEHTYKIDITAIYSAPDFGSYMQQFLQDLELQRSLLCESDMQDEIFLGPKACMHLIQSNIPCSADIKKCEKDSVGSIGDFSCRSPLFQRTELRNLEGLSSYQIEYRIWRKS